MAFQTVAMQSSAKEFMEKKTKQEISAEGMC
jgi:hypothetical protein